jgi:hypothetical protein
MTSIEPILYEGKEIVPLQFLKAMLPDPASLGPRNVGKTNIGCIFAAKGRQGETYYFITSATIRKATARSVPRPFPYHRRARHDRRDAGDERYMAAAGRLHRGRI